MDRTTIYRMLNDGRLNGVKVGNQWRFFTSEVEDLLAGAHRLIDKNIPVDVNVLPLHCVQLIQDVFAEITAVTSVTTDKDGNPLTQISNSCDFCKLILGSEAGRQACIDSWRKLAEQKKTAPEFTICHAGLQCARARIEVGGEMIAILVAGQFYVQKPDPNDENEHLLALASKYDIDEGLLKQAAEQVSVFDDQKISRFAGWLERVARMLEQFSSERADLLCRLRQIAEMSVINP